MNLTAFYAAARPIFGGELSQEQVSGEMCPTLATVDHANHGARDAIFGGNVVLANATLSLGAYLAHSVIGQFCRVVFAVGMATLRSHVGKIVGARSYEQMRWVYAGRVVTAVANAKPLRHRTVRQLPRQNVGIRQTFGPPPLPDHPVPSSDMTKALPFPAFVRPALVYFCPKSINKWFHLQGVAQ